MNHSIEKENVICELEDDYKCNFKEYFGLIDLVHPIGMDVTNIEKYYNNPNIYVLIIRPMSLGIVMNKHVALQFKYIEGLIILKSYSVIYDDGMKIIKLDDTWDTSKWYYTKLSIILSHTYIY